MVLAYTYSNYFKGREAYKYSNEISLYIDKDSRYKRYGKLLYLELEKRLKNNCITNVYSYISHIEIEDEYLDINSESFHDHLGFKRV